MKDNEMVVVDGKTYVYSEYYQRLNRIQEEDSARSVMCPKCHGTRFTIGYGEWECLATCPCGHSMTVYDG